MITDCFGSIVERALAKKGRTKDARIEASITKCKTSMAIFSVLCAILFTLCAMNRVIGQVETSDM